MNWIALLLIAAVFGVVLAGTIPSYAASADTSKTAQIKKTETPKPITTTQIVKPLTTKTLSLTDNKAAKQLTLEDVLNKSSPSIKEAKVIEEITKLQQVAGTQMTEEEITKKSFVVQELLKTYDELLDPTVLAEIQNGEVERAHGIVKAHTKNIEGIVKLTPSNNIKKDGIVGSVSSLNQLIPKQLNMLDILG